MFGLDSVLWEQPFWHPSSESMRHVSHFTTTGRSTRIRAVRFQHLFFLLFVSAKQLLTSMFPDHCQAAVSKPIVWSTFISSVITDIYLLIVPIPMLWGTTLRLAKKISISIVLGAGIFVLVCSLLKTVFVETVSPATPNWYMVR